MSEPYESIIAAKDKRIRELEAEVALLTSRLNTHHQGVQPWAFGGGGVAMNLPDLTPLFYLAIVGLLSLVMGGVVLLWWIISHLQWVSP